MIDLSSSSKIGRDADVRFVNFSFYFSSFATAFGLFLNWLTKLDMKFYAFTKNMRLAGSSVIWFWENNLSKNSTLLLVLYVAIILSRSSSIVFVLRGGTLRLDLYLFSSKRLKKVEQLWIASTIICLISKVGSNKSLYLAKDSLMLVLTSSSKTYTSLINRLSG